MKTEDIAGTWREDPARPGGFHFETDDPVTLWPGDVLEVAFPSPLAVIHRASRPRRWWVALRAWLHGQRGPHLRGELRR